jgi:hypothetical protein
MLVLPKGLSLCGKIQYSRDVYDVALLVFVLISAEQHERRLSIE